MADEKKYLKLNDIEAIKLTNEKIEYLIKNSVKHKTIQE